MTTPSILVVDDDPIVCSSLAELLELEGYNVQTAPDGETALEMTDSAEFDIILADVSMPGISGFDLLRKLQANNSETGVIMITAFGTVQDAVAAIKNGAYNYVVKPLLDDEIKIMIRRCLDQQQMQMENIELRRQLDHRLGFQNLVGNDVQMQRIYKLIAAVADTRTTVLINGESGTGKSVIARIIHHNSSRANKPLIEVSCGALPDTLLESELFGHVRGSFTGASADKPGKFELADGGTIFLDEIDAASPALQVKLLRVLQEREFERVGGNNTYAVDVRVILATNTDLARRVEHGQFREDLYYRVNVVSLEIPPLRERPDDVPLLADHFLQQFAARSGRAVKGLDPAAINALVHYPWPGNVRELENVIERSVVLTRGEYITRDDLPPDVLEGAIEASAAREVLPLREALEAPERRLIEHALHLNNWNRFKTADMLKVNRTTLFNKMRKYNLFPPESD